MDSALIELKYVKIWDVRYCMDLVGIDIKNHAVGNPGIVRMLSSQPSRKPGFFGQFIDNIKQEMERNKEMKENVKKFREEAQKLEQSEALRSARKKYEDFEKETARGTQAFRETFTSVKEKLGETIEEVQKSEYIKKAGQITEDLGKKAYTAAETVSKAGESISKMGPFKTIKSGVEAVEQEIDSRARMYRAPQKLRKRVETSEHRDVQVNTEATGLELHKDSKWFQSWQNFKDNNPYVNKILDWKVKYDESENPVVRASRMLTDKVTDIMGGLFQKTELSQTLTEICKMDPNFDKNEFLKMCETEIIPNILEAMIRGDLEILRDWCHEAPFNVLATPIRTAQQLGYKFDSKVLDVDNVDLSMGKVMEQGPVLIITFTSQQILSVRDASGTVVEGDPNKILRVNYVWVLCRDPNELNASAAWKLMDLSAHRLLVKGSQDAKNKYSYSTIGAVLMTEVLKLFLSLFIYFYKDGNMKTLWHDICQSRQVLLLYFVPAFLYCLYNNLAFTNLGTFDPTTYFLLLQLRVVVTGVCFQALFKKILTFRQWISLLILTFGCIVKNIGVTKPQNEARELSSSLPEVIFSHITAALFNIGIIFILLQVFASSFAGVFNEYLLKGYGAKTPLMVQNLYMYFNSIICNLFLMYLDQTVVQIQDSSYWKNLFDPKVFLIIVNNAAIGIVTSFFLHQLNSILKAFASALELVFTAVLTWIIFGIPIDGYTFAALVIVIYATLLYSQSPVVNVARTGTS
ncbi:unnamed protein product [Darwinula stevensoni]|uniref:Mitochondrial import inner membrane translocase subunit TIM44 n=1 Tax=Darwinula stevensoni TaxID=69355 RepID=A0A7R9A442_9CRUS|nr:unnamed protein product [Darwinula stevensoni]CAG0892883.1 unnamed protein product [Darwinula stevensoni]